MNVEHNAEWLKKQRASIVKAINEVISVVATEALKPNYQPRYHIELSVGISGRMVDLRVYDTVTNDQVDKSSIWNLDRVLEEGWLQFNKECIEIQVGVCLKELRVMKAVAVKYANLNAGNKL